MTEVFMLECEFLSDQIRRAFDGEAWHGDPLMEILKGVSAATAAAHPINSAHSIWEIVGHIRCWDGATVTRIGGKAFEPADEENFPPVKDTSEAAWRSAVEEMKKTHAELVKQVAAFPDRRLGEPVPGKTQPYYTFRYLFSGIVQHELYHAGQIVMLKKAAG
jgi:uncharacterized damage-inducible protein DinB